ncbi:hypothetical protein H2198_000872 [Neophaeococcomyces mojaviensis]|uniref:Uncharacterized protein n=1 Tax=Neophaeococcomyces mojaviensis TaxID=3383035 RepID=A0ACC3AJI9_9EURO|nr:hypothetical protein H2198_000872 [Knufia sp. JES_112]
MGRTTPSVGAPPPSQRRDARAKRAKQTANKDIPALLQSYPRARKGIDAAELVVDPPPVTAQTISRHPDTGKPKTTSSSNEGDGGDIEGLTNQENEQSSPAIGLRCADTLQVAAQLHQTAKERKTKASSRIAILNMASPLRPGGGFFTGATSQEESLCMRTTLYPSLREEFYRLPEVGGIYTPDVLVFRSHDPGAADFSKNERFFVDVVTAGMLRFPEVDEDEDGNKSYASGKDRDLVEQKMRAVLRIVRMKEVRKVVLGAWGCGAYGNPVGEVARCWKRVLLAEESKDRHSRKRQSMPVPEMWAGMEVVFAIKDRKMAEVFSQVFELEIEGDTGDDEGGGNEDEAEDEDVDGEKAKKIVELEEQMARARSNVLRDRLKSIVDNLKQSDA